MDADDDSTDDDTWDELTITCATFAAVCGSRSEFVVAISSVLPFSDAKANAADIFGFDCDRIRLKDGILDRSSDNPKFPSCVVVVVVVVGGGSSADA
jgi:hypothetical protein